jgi:glycosyltransferase involved in cell wall biosynthesis
MENISQTAAPIRDKTTSNPDILIISCRFQPKEGGVEEYIYGRCLKDPERIIVLAARCSGDKPFDKAQKFPVYRWPISQYWRGSYAGRILQSLLNIFWSFVLAIALYFRYRYCYIEWGHGDHFLWILLLSYLLPIRFSIYLYGKDMARLSCNPLRRPFFKLTVNRADRIVCNSSSTRDFLLTHFQCNTPTYVMNPKVRVEKFGAITKPGCLDELRDRVRKNYRIPENAVVILSVGKLAKYKGFDRVIENLPLLLTLGIDVYYILCGYGSYESKLKSLSYRLRVHSRVHFAGYIPDRELAGYYAACDIFAMLTSYDNRNMNVGGFSMTCLEAAYFGKPIIASCVGSVLDTVHHEENGILVNPNSGYEVFQAFKRLCQDKKLREQLSRRGKQF